MAPQLKFLFVFSRYRIYPFTNWKEGHPNDATNGHCLAVEPATFKWVDTHCDDLGFFFCEQSNIFS